MCDVNGKETGKSIVCENFLRDSVWVWSSEVIARSEKKCDDSRDEIFLSIINIIIIVFEWKST
jgi:hypothetical protein